ncbi:MAG: MMPL family transporter [Acidimicrobiia bacterium]|nr:MMPL family transporter [Acidimicrobiia bacterium]MYB73088.1 MMPL family transporter [Acidimicrobiia bacterium]MYH95238.1 MMPL family transporter [Acidimicrobiia bacterium]MYI00017.1 MMPL family transporter [Acidimicrobiia bacterium]
MLDWYARLVTRSPWRTIAVIALITAAMLPGVALTTEEPDAMGSFVPAGSDLARAVEELEARFPESGAFTSAQIVARGNVTSPEVIREVIARSEMALAHPEVAPFVPQDGQPVVRSYAHLIVALAGVPPAQLTAEDVTRALAVDPAADPRAAQFDQLLSDSAGLGQVRLQQIDLPDLDSFDALLVVNDVIQEGDYGPNASARTLSNARFQEGAQQALTDSGFLFPLALVVMVVVLAVLFRSPADTAITIIGVVLTALWQIGLSGYLGPDGLDKINGITPISIIVPVLLVGLTVDYSLQIVSRRREERDADPRRATSRAVSLTGAAIGLGALTTALSFLTNLASPLSPIRDFGILAACGIIAGFFIMTSLVPAVRILGDRRRIARGRPLRTRPVIDSVPGVRRLLEPMVARCARHPKLTLLAVAALAGAAVAGGINVDTEFKEDEFLPEDSEVVQDIRLARQEVGGLSTTITGVVITDLDDPTAAKALVALDDRLRGPGPGSGESAPPGLEQPDHVVGVGGTTLVSLASETVPNARAVFSQGSSDDLAQLYRQVSEAAPDDFAKIASLADSSGNDVTIIPIQAYFGSDSDARDLYNASGDLWADDAPGNFTVTGAQINPGVTTNAVARSQTTATFITVLTALALLTAYFWRAHRRPLLGAITVAPIVVVLILLLGFMWVMGINYNALTALLTSLTIGIGVDYTIHFAHRYLHERERGAEIADALTITANSVGGALFGSATTTALGFIVLAFAPLLVVSQLGILIAITGILSMMAAVIILPCLLVLADRRAQPVSG